MKRIVIAGGIGAGKSATSEYLISLGWPVIDSDKIAHDVIQPGLPAYLALRDAFGNAVLNADGTIDRAFLADVVFHDRSALRRLNLITHGHIGVEILRQLDATTGPAAFIALPLFRPEHRELLQLDEVWAVLVQPETALARLIEYRGFTLADATARVESQMTNAQRTAIVDRDIWNEGTLDELHQQLDAALSESGLERG